MADQDRATELVVHGVVLEVSEADRADGITHYLVLESDDLTTTAAIQARVVYLLAQTPTIDKQITVFVGNLDEEKAHIILDFVLDNMNAALPDATGVWWIVPQRAPSTKED